MKFYLVILSILLSSFHLGASPKSAKGDDFIPVSNTKKANKEQSKIIEQLKIKEGEYSLKLGPEEKCYEGDLEFVYLAQGRLSVLIGGRLLLGDLSSESSERIYEEHSCKTTVRSQIKDQSVTQEIDAKCEKAEESYLLRRIVNFSESGIRYSIFFTEAKENPKTENVTCELSL